jgi:drug/metabolite transporter (DMT)-like permease
MKKSPESAITPLVQKVFVGAAISAVAMQFVQLFYFVIQQYPYNKNFSGYISWFTGLASVLVIIAIVYASRTKRTLSLRTLYEVSLMSMSVVLVATVVSTLLLLMPLYSYISNNSQIFVYGLIYQGVPLLVALVATYFVARQLRRTKQW